MELTFDTKVYKTAVTKNATIYSNDLTNPQAKIYVSAKVDLAPDPSAPVTWEPNRVDFGLDTRSAEVTITNTSKGKVNLVSAGDKWENLEVSIDKSDLDPGAQAKIRLEWKGEPEKENYERSATFIAGGLGDTRFTIPFMVAGTNPTPKPEPKKKAASLPSNIKNIPGTESVKPATKKSGE